LEYRLNQKKNIVSKNIKSLNNILFVKKKQTIDYNKKIKILKFTVKYVWLKCTFDSPSFTNLQFWPPYFQNSTFGPNVLAPLQNHGPP